METAADIVGVLVIIWGALALVTALAQKLLFKSAKKGAFSDPFFDDFHKGANVIPVLSTVVGLVLIVGGYFITTIG